ncbi:MAG: hypothetical protein ABI995_05030 [Acidobacteriota bacterium]
MDTIWVVYAVWIGVVGAQVKEHHRGVILSLEAAPSASAPQKSLVSLLSA